jgi:hypothetical protein
MIARTSNILRWLDRWLLLRAPLLWRTRLPYLLILLIVAVMAALALTQRGIKNPIDAADFGSNMVTWWWWQLFGAMAVLYWWVQSIIGKPVGELPPHRHIVTVAAVAVGSYLWLITPNLLAYPQINAIKQVEVREPDLNKDSNFLSKYSDWKCVPQYVWELDKSELEQLNDVLARYYGHKFDLKKGSYKEESIFIRDCHVQGDSPLHQSRIIDRSKEAISTIEDARRPNKMNTFYWISLAWWLTAAGALGIGLLTAILSYPSYVWQRTFGTD